MRIRIGVWIDREEEEESSDWNQFTKVVDSVE